MPTDTKVKQLIINYLTKAQYEALTTKNADELYFITDDNEYVDQAALDKKQDKIIPDVPTDDGTYTLQAVVASGAVTYSWVKTA